MASFQGKSPAQICHVSSLGTLRSPHSSSKPGCHTWNIAFSSDERHFAWSCGQRIVKVFVWEKLITYLKSKRNSTDNTDQDSQLSECVTIDCGQVVTALTFIPWQDSGRDQFSWLRGRYNGPLLATGLKNGRIRIWDISAERSALELVDHSGAITDLSFTFGQYTRQPAMSIGHQTKQPSTSRHHLRLVSASRDKTVKVWNLNESGNLVVTLRFVNQIVLGCAWSPNGQWLAAVGAGKMIVIWNAVTYAFHRKLTGHLHDVTSCAFSPAGDVLLTSSCDTRVVMWDHVTGEQLKTFCHLDPAPSMIYAGGANETWVRGVTFSQDGCHIASVADDGYLRVWDVFTEEIVQIDEIQDSICCQFSPSGRYLATGLQNSGVKFCEVAVRFPTLQHLCRSIIKFILTSEEVRTLNLPRTIKDMLTYK